MFNNRRVQPGKIKPKSSTMLSLGLAAIMLMSVPGQIVLSYALTSQRGQNVQEQIIESESGYRLYADDLTSSSGTVKGDMTEVLPGYEIINVKLPDGSLAKPEEVNFPVTESGAYTFEVLYNSVSNNADPTKTVEMQSMEQEAEEHSDSDVRSEPAEDTEIEELTLMVTLPEEEAAEETETEETEEFVQEDAQNTESELQEITSRNGITASLQSNSNISTRAGGFEQTNWATSNKTWSTTDFTTKYGYYSNGHMNYGSDPGGNTILTDSLSSKFDSTKGVQFTFGAQMGTVTSQAYWLQQGAAFSDITFDFTKDFALEGYMRIGSEFGCSGTENPHNTAMQIDGGVTISFIPTDQINNARANAKLAKGAAYRLGAYGTLQNSIVCEFDTSTETYYDIESNGRNFVISADDVRKTGDYNYVNNTVHAWNSLAGKDIYNEANVNGIKNGTHIGISTTAADGYVPVVSAGRAAYTSDRVLLGSSDTGTIPYQVTYNSADEILTFTVKEADDDPDYRSISYDLTEYFKRQTNKNLNLAFTYGAAYTNLSAFVQTSNNPYFTGQRTGQIDIWAKEMYAVPNLKTGTTEVRWLNNAFEKAGASIEKNAYWNGSSYDYSSKKYWPVAGDRIYIQNNFTPRTSLDPPTSSIQSGTLTLKVNELSIKNTSGQAISGVSPPNPKLYYRLGDNGNWIEYTTGSKITVSGSQVVYIRVEMTLPQLNDNATEQYNVTGKIEGVYNVGGSTVNHTLDLMTENGEKITVSRNPMFIGFNGQDSYNNVRVIKSTESIAQLKNITNGGNKDTANTGDKTSLHYGSGYRLMSAGGDYYPMYQDRSGTGSGTYDLKRVKLQSASMDNLSVTTEENVLHGKAYTVDNSQDTRYIIEYLIEDSDYSSKSSALTQNSNRGKSTGKRVLWTSDNVEVSNGYEFYAKSSVTMSPEDFAGFESAADKTSYYNKIAKEAGATIFKTSDYSFTNKVNGTYSNVTGTGNHTGVTTALKSPGTPCDVTLRFKENGAQVERTIRLTIVENIKPITLVGGRYETTSAAEVKLRANADGSSTYSLTAEFEMEGQVIDSAQQAYYAIYGQDEQTGNNPAQNWRKIASGNFDNIGNPTAQKIPGASSGGNYWGYLEGANVTVEATYDGTGDKTNITLEISNITKLGSGGNHKNWRIYMWNSANGSQTANGLRQTFDNTDALEAVFPTTQYPYNLEKIILLYPFANSITTVNNTPTFGYEATEYNVPAIQTGGNRAEGAGAADGTATLQATFKYTGRWEDYVGEQFRVALYRTGNNGSGTPIDPVRWVWYTGTIPQLTSDSDTGLLTGTIDISTNRPEVAVNGLKSTAGLTVNTTDQTFTISFDLRNANDNKLRYTWEDATGPSARVWKVFAWNDSNGNGSADAITAASNVEPTSTDNTAKFPQVDNKLHITPKKIKTNQPDSVDIEHKTSTKEGLHEGEAFTIEATFEVDPYYPISLQLGTAAGNYGDATDREDGKLHLSLMKKNPGSNTWNVWIYDNVVSPHGKMGNGTAKVEVAPISSDAGNTDYASQITVTYTILNVQNSMEWQWEHSAQYEVFAWNDANHNKLAEATINVGNTTGANNLRSLLRDTAVYAAVPSVTTTTKLAWQEPSVYVIIPSAPTLTDDSGNVSSSIGNSGDYAGTEAEVAMITADDEDYETEMPTIRVQIEVNEDSENAITITHLDAEGTPTQKTVSIHNSDGTYRTGNQTSAESSAGTQKKITLGVLTEDTSGGNTYQVSDGENDAISVPKGTILPFWLNTPKDKKSENGTAYSGTMTFVLTHLMQDPTTPVSAETGTP